VLLPAPFLPIMPTASPFFMSNEMSFKAQKSVSFSEVLLFENRFVKVSLRLPLVDVPILYNFDNSSTLIAISDIMYFLLYIVKKNPTLVYFLAKSMPLGQI